MTSSIRVEREAESLRRPFTVSTLLHLLLFVVLVSASLFSFSRGVDWGSTLGGGKAVRVSSIRSLQGIPLPPSVRAATSTVANETRGLHKSQPKPKPRPAPETQIPKFDKEVRPPKFERINPRIQEEEPEIPDNAIPFGEGGAPAISYAQFANSAGQGGFSLEAEFGERYAWYVDAVRARISQNWLLATISPNILTAPRLFVTFDILRNGQITQAKVTQSSGIREVDRSGLRAVLASSPLAPLPRAYSGSKVTVEFWFDFRRR